MTTTAWFFDGTTLGDADQAPYDDTEIAAPLARFGNFVVPDVTNELLVSGGYTGKVVVAPGRAVVYGYAYVNDADLDVSIPDATNNRIDYIVLRADVSAQTVRVTRIEGTEAANPSPPALTSEDFPLATVWLDAGYTTAATIDDTDVRDERNFGVIGSLQTYPTYENLLKNSEYLLRRGDSIADHWGYFAAPTAVTLSEGSNRDQPRTNAINVVATTTAGRGIEQSVDVAENTVYTVKGRLYITSGNAVVRVVYGGTPTVITEKHFFRTGAELDVLERFTVPDGVTSIKLQIYTTTNGGSLDIGGFIVTPGRIGGGFSIYNEIAFCLGSQQTDASWNTTAKSTGNTTLTLASSFSNSINAYIRGVILGLRARDSGSAAGTPSLNTIYPGVSTILSSVRLAGVGNDKMRERNGYAPLSQAGTQIGLRVEASGAGTLDAEVRIIGIIT